MNCREEQESSPSLDSQVQVSQVVRAVKWKVQESSTSVEYQVELSSSEVQESGAATFTLFATPLS